MSLEDSSLGTVWVEARPQWGAEWTSSKGRRLKSKYSFESVAKKFWKRAGRK